MNGNYLIHGEDYLAHINDKVRLYSMVKQLAYLVGKLPEKKSTEGLRRIARHFQSQSEAMFASWGIPGSYLVCGDESDLTELMENELIAPEDAGYLPIEALCCADCGACCGMDEDGADAEDEDLPHENGETVTAFTEELVRSVFGCDAEIRIFVE